MRSAVFRRICSALSSRSSEPRHGTETEKVPGAHAIARRRRVIQEVFAAQKYSAILTIMIEVGAVAFIPE